MITVTYLVMANVVKQVSRREERVGHATFMLFFLHHFADKKAVISVVQCLMKGDLTLCNIESQNSLGWRGGC